MNQPYLPDSARQGMPNSAMQPLPAYLREDFSQSLDRQRPHELLPQYRKGKPFPPEKQHCLQYKYLDTGETTTVPNIWYNQTIDMRNSHWDFVLAHNERHVKTLLAEQAVILAYSGPFYRGQPIERAKRNIQEAVNSAQELMERVKHVRQAVRDGLQFC